MGYKRAKKIYRLKFEDPEMEGLEVDTTGASIDEFTALTDLTDLSEFAVDGVEITKENLAQVAGAAAKVDDLFRAFAKHLVSWNLEDDGSDGDAIPVPATFEGVKSQDAEFILELIAAWMEAVGGVSGPKDRRSNGGKPSLAASIPMETLSPNPTTSPAPSSSSGPANDSDVSLAS